MLIYCRYESTPAKPVTLQILNLTQRTRLPSLRYVKCSQCWHLFENKAVNTSHIYITSWNMPGKIFLRVSNHVSPHRKLEVSLLDRTCSDFRLYQISQNVSRYLPLWTNSCRNSSREHGQLEERWIAYVLPVMTFCISGTVGVTRKYNTRFYAELIKQVRKQL
jgi:hypothetical protein